ncbi:MAG: hypothetical protein NVSMB9_09040 [Isosphaeraceae bacterium]
MRRSTIRRSFCLESLEARELLTSGGPTQDGQMLLHLINLSRTNPAAAADYVTANLDADVEATLKYYGVNLAAEKDAIAHSASRPPVAWDATLSATATQQSQDQITTGVQSHTGADGSSLGQRLDRAGYTHRVSDGENAYAYSKSVDHAIEAFEIDWGVANYGHRDNVHQSKASPDQYYREVGIGIVKSDRPNMGPMVVTEDFGRRADTRAQLVGVAYNDPNQSHAFTLGSGQGDVKITATNLDTGVSQSTLSWDAGGYQLPLDPGTYEVTAKVGDRTVRTDRIGISDQNVMLDYNLSDPWQAAESTPPPAASTPTPRTEIFVPTAPVAGSTPLVGKAETRSTWFTSWSAWTARKS